MRDLGKLIVAKGFKKLPKVQKIAQSGHTAAIPSFNPSLFRMQKTDFKCFHRPWLLPRNGQVKNLSMLQSGKAAPFQGWRHKFLCLKKRSDFCSNFCLIWLYIYFFDFQCYLKSKTFLCKFYLFFSSAGSLSTFLIKLFIWSSGVPALNTSVHLVKTNVV